MKKKKKFTCVAMNGTILNPAISPKIKIWTAAIIINFIVKHHVLRTYQCRVLHENIKNYQRTDSPESRLEGNGLEVFTLFCSNLLKAFKIQNNLTIRQYHMQAYF